MTDKTRDSRTEARRDAQWGVRAVERAFDILFAFEPRESMLSLGEISKRVGLSKSTVHRFLASLEQKGLVEADHDAGAYSLGLGIARLAHVYYSQLDLAAIARPVLRRLRDITGESASVITRSSGSSCHAVAVAESHQEIGYRVALGASLPLFTGSAKALLAGLPDEEIERLLAETPVTRYTERTITDPVRLRETIREIRRRGYATGEGEFVEGARSVAAPILDAAGRTVGVISVVGPSFRVTDEKEQQYLKLVLDAAAEVSAALGHHPRSPAARE